MCVPERKQLVSTWARAWLTVGAPEILGNLEAAAGVGVGAGARAQERRGDPRMEQGPRWGFLGPGLGPRLQPFNSMHVHRAPTVCQVLGTVQGQRVSPAEVNGAIPSMEGGRGRRLGGS